MYKTRLSWWKPLLALTAAALVSCTDGPQLVDPQSSTTDFDHRGPDGPIAERGHLDVCVHPSAPAGTYVFQKTAGSVVDTYTLSPNQCARVWTRLNPTGSPIDPSVPVTLTLLSHPTEIVGRPLRFEHMDGTARYTLNPAARQITYQMNVWHGAVAVVFALHDQGCVPEQWRRISNPWAAAGIDPNASFDSYFGVDFFDPDVTLQQALQMGASPELHYLARHAVAAALNAQHSGVKFPLTLAQIRHIVQQAYSGARTVNDVAQLLDRANQLGCPL
ncbi:MAG: hypothetical protein ACR2H9_13850 [Longimicrobiaceae bacterium]